MKCEICKQDHSTQSSDYLIREYLELNKARFDRMFGRNATRCQAVVAHVLITRGITEIPNIFGPIEIRA